MNPLAIIAKIIAAIAAFWASLSDTQKKRIVDAILDMLEPLIRKFYNQKTTKGS